ncbi:MAG: PhoH family protein [Flavobacteriales bacterium]|nr:PhoH family protein [Flavobacteriales bacterium]
MTARKKTKKIYVLDTSVILHDHNAIFHFDEHDIAIPITVLEELDNFKKGNSPKNYEAREFIRIIDRISGNYSLQEWIPIDGKEKGRVKIVMNESGPSVDANRVFDQKKPDHKILNAALTLAEEEKTTRVVLVTKDINLRLKAKALNLIAEDYETGKIQDIKNLYTGRVCIEDIPTDTIMKLYKDGELADTDILGDFKINNHFFILKNGKTSSLAYFNPFDNSIKKVEKQYTYGIKPRNAEQTFAMHAIMNPDIKVVTIQGVAGTGKTLLALAGCLEQKSLYNQIILARPIVPLSNKDLGYLPGDVNDKINPYMEPLWDNLKFIKNQFGENEKRSKMIDQMQKEEKIVIAPLAYIRGRSISDSIFIVDESQNLTPHEVKTIITRAGENTKIIFTGDVFQIDTPYLDEQSNGLSYLIDRLKGNKLFAHITLEKGERSELANLANELL